MNRTASGTESGIPADLLEALRGIQHQLGNAISAVASHAAIIERWGPSAEINRGTLSGLSLASDQAVSVAACLRHLLICWDPKLVRTDASTVLNQVRDLVHALSTRPMAIDTEQAGSPGWSCEAHDCFVLLALVLFVYREHLREADRIRIAGEFLPSAAPGDGAEPPTGQVTIELIASRTRAAPVTETGHGGPTTPPAMSEVLRHKMDKLGARATWERRGPTESVLRIALPGRQQAR